MSEKKLIVDSFNIDPKHMKPWTVMTESEEDRVVDGVNILARVAGPFFTVNGESLNGRFYSDKLWEKAIFESAERMSYGEVLGTIGHEQPLDDQSLLEGKASHKVTKLWIDEDTGVGMGEIQVLNTDAGRNLNALLRGGVRLKVSSRATGEYKGTTKSGSKVIDPDTFKLEGFDFVQRPGVPTAIPVLVESENQDNIDTDDNISENNMSTELLESLSKDKAKLQLALDEALNTVKSKTNEADALSQSIALKDKEIGRLEESVANSNRKVTVLEGQVADLQTTVSGYKDLGTAEQVAKALDEAEAMLVQYKEFGTPEELTEAFNRIDTLVEDYKDLGSPDELSGMLDVVSNYSELGNLEELGSKLESLGKYEALGNPEEIKNLKATLESYAALGTPEDISKAFDMTESIVSKSKDEAFRKDVESIATEFGVKSEAVEAMVKKHGVSETKSLLESIKGDAVADRYDATSKTKKPVQNESLNEDHQESELRTRGGSLTSRLMESFSK
ncbi:prohead core scaffolding and protease protein [Rhizobium phage RHph_TM61]|nr:prohead core scaffolding and protease protein [Rhizobium phage RHph_TM61]